MQKIDEITKNTLDVLVYVQQLTNDVDRLYPKEKCDDTEKSIVPDE